MYITILLYIDVDYVAKQNYFLFARRHLELKFQACSRISFVFETLEVYFITFSTIFKNPHISYIWQK